MTVVLTHLLMRIECEMVASISMGSDGFSKFSFARAWVSGRNLAAVAAQVEETHDCPLVALELLLGRLLHPHAFGLGLLPRHGALAADRVVPLRDRGARPQRRVLVCHLGLVDLPETLGHGLALVQVREDGPEAGTARRRRSLLLVDIDDRCRSGRRRRRRRTTSRWRGRGRRGRRSAHRQRLCYLGRREAFGVPRDAVLEVVLDILGQVLEYLVKRLYPLDLPGIPRSLVSQA